MGQIYTGMCKYHEELNHLQIWISGVLEFVINIKELSIVYRFNKQYMIMCQRLLHEVDTGVCLKIAIQVRDGASNSFISGLFQETLC